MIGVYFLMVVVLIWKFVMFLIQKMYNFVSLQWEEYISKKIDSRVRTLNGKQYMHLDVKDSNIIYPDDIESGKTYYQQTEKTIIEEEIESSSDNESTNTLSEDGVMINISDIDGFKK
jgi:hypothetical protein